MKYVLRAWGDNTLKMPYILEVYIGHFEGLVTPSSFLVNLG